jgi:menaquinone-specific isochorismate synthase
MPVAPRYASLFQDRKQLYQFLFNCQQRSLEKNHAQIASISLEIDAVDPLAILHSVAQPNQPHFYLEQSATGEKIAAIGCAVSLDVKGNQRFEKTRQFIQSHFDHIVLASDHKGAHINSLPPRFFCSFPFFDYPSSSQSSIAVSNIFLPLWQILQQHDQCYVTTNWVVQARTNIDQLTETIWHQFQAIQLAKYGVFHLPDEIRHTFNKWDITDTDRFVSTVAEALKPIQLHRLNKIVLAHAIDVVARFPFQWTRSLHNLRQLHPDCHVFSTSNGQGQSFIGASPERLISVRNGLLMTDALAGSAARGKTPQQDHNLAQRLLASKKERHEHHVVVEFLTQTLRQLGLHPQFASAPQLLQLSNIQHLHTPIRATMPTHLHPLDVLAELHPTPAVAGMPRDIACHLIRRLEPFERSLYAAPLGWVDAQGDAEFIVGIRSASINGHHARLYAGAGIVAGSEPEREMAEVRLKLQALLQALV